MSSFDSHYESFHDKRTDLKAKIGSIDKAITSLMSISQHDEITSLATATSTSIVEAQFIVNQYDLAVSSLREAINDITDEDKKNEELQHFTQQMEEDIFDGGNEITVSPSCLKALVRDKKMVYDLSLAETLNRIKLLTSLSSLPTSVIPPSVIPPSVIPSSVNSSIPSPVHANSAQGEETNHSLNDSASIGQLSSTIVQILNQISSSNVRPNLSLPPVRLETFDGSDLTRWPAYRYQIDQLILNQSCLSEVEKAFHVRNSLRGSAFNLVASIPVHEKFLDKIVNRLESHYGRNSLSQAKLIQSLRGIRSQSTSVTDQLTAVQSMISIAHSIHSESGVDSLCVQQMLAECIHPRFITLISRSKPKTLLASLELIENQLLSEYEDALTISAYTTGEEFASHFNDHSSSTSFNPPINRDRRENNQSIMSSHTNHSPPNARSANGRQPHCVYCGEHLYSGECTQVSTIKDRKEILQRKSLCHCCFSPFHSTSECTRSCSSCKGKHHKSICDKSSIHHTTVNTITADQSIQINTRLFTAPVVLTNSTRTECSRATVLLDPGAQISLISRTLATRLQLSPVSQLNVSIKGLKGHHDVHDPPSHHDIVEFQLITERGPETIKAAVRNTDTIIGTIHHPPLSAADLAVIKSTLTTIPNHFGDTSVYPDLLLGVGDSLKLLDSNKSTTLPSGYRLIQSIIGPLIAGSEHISSSTSATIHRSQSTTPAIRIDSLATSTDDSTVQIIKPHVQSLKVASIAIQPIHFMTHAKIPSSPNQSFSSSSPEDSTVQTHCNSNSIHIIPSSHRSHHVKWIHRSDHDYSRQLAHKRVHSLQRHILQDSPHALRLPRQKSTSTPDHYF
ncbi:hypothetical protein PRIPAC_92619 [Pristionchus pacificus]|uniref:Uncharacterized protein n=1 Tax=Pristionchus pacificus TaxID=54126 RepID=A0A2A6CE40_PRIPA|nr:hypothetical protein PRIPAC_92619 [Pristionchus pacificus]|eukprot:PDM76379.1 hypothetical protein PRIPAC_39983 [Pristionchus pacificus]